MKRSRNSTGEAAAHRLAAPRKRFGQHFLEPAWVAKLIAAIDPRPDERFVEIGPGRGALTRPLAARAKSVATVEIDRDLARALSASAPPNVRVVEGDMLALDAEQFLGDEPRCSASRLSPTDPRLPPPDSRLRVAGNLPYNVASPILFRLAEMWEAGVPFTDATVMLQREVADRLLAVPGTKAYGVLTVLIRHGAEVTRLLNLPPGAFRPAPKVHSTVVRLRFHAHNPPVRDVQVFREVVQAVFTRRRKTLANALLAYSGARHVPGTCLAPALARAGLDGRRRPETLTVAEFGRLADALSPAPHKT